MCVCLVRHHFWNCRRLLLRDDFYCFVLTRDDDHDNNQRYVSLQCANLLLSLVNSDKNVEHQVVHMVEECKVLVLPQIRQNRTLFDVIYRLSCLRRQQNMSSNTLPNTLHIVCAFLSLRRFPKREFNYFMLPPDIDPLCQRSKSKPSLAP